MKSLVYRYSAFICHASADTEKATQLCQTLETRGLKCWIAPRDLASCGDHDKENIKALEVSRCMVLLLSEAANNSEDVLREAKIAVGKGRTVYAVRLEEILPAPSLQTIMPSNQWIDLWGGQVIQGVNDLCRYLTAGTAQVAKQTKPQAGRPVSTQPVATAKPSPAKSGSGKIVALLIALVLLFPTLLICAGVGVYLYIDNDKPADVRSAVPSAPVPDQVDSDIPSEQLLIKLLSAIDAEDYAAVKSYAHSLFKDRKDLEIGEYTGKLRGPVLAAAAEGDVDLMRALAQAKPVFGVEDKRGREPIHVAAASSHTELVAFLIEEINVSPDDKTDGTAFTAMHWASQAGHADVITKLGELKANPNAVSNNGATPLHIAVQNQQFLAIKALLKLQGIDVNATNAHGQTPLHLAATKGSATVVNQLLIAGANPAIKDLAGKNAGEVAYAASHDGLAAKLGVTVAP